MTGAHRILRPDDPDSTAAGLCALAIMTKAPRAGTVKTRLSPPLTAQEAAALNVCFLRDTAAAIAQIRQGARGIGCYTPVGAEDDYRQIFPSAFQLIAQRGADFGDRLTFAVEDLLQVGFGSVCLIDSDSPTVPPDAFAEAVKILAAPNESLVLGPSDDGGYYLIGMKHLQRRLFEDIAWSSERVLEQTMERAAELKLQVHLLPVWYDVDDRSTLRRLWDELLVPNESSGGFAAPATRQFLEKELPNLAGR